MRAKQLREHFYWTGVLDEQLRVFDIIMYTEFGTTYNSYVYGAGDKTILFETAKAKYFDEYLKVLEEVTDVKKIDYLVVSHTEPDHAGSVERLLDLNPGLKVIATPTAISFLKHIVNRDFFSIAVKDGQEMKIGTLTMRFLHVPNLHWPDTMYTYLEEEQALALQAQLASHDRDSPSIGLRNLARRLDLKYGSKSGVEVVNHEGRGFEVLVRIEDRRNPTCTKS